MENGNHVQPKNDLTPLEKKNDKENISLQIKQKRTLDFKIYLFLIGNKILLRGTTQCTKCAQGGNKLQQIKLKKKLSAMKQQTQ